jgi:hypothetical protein
VEDSLEWDVVVVIIAHLEWGLSLPSVFVQSVAKQ